MNTLAMRTATAFVGGQELSVELENSHPL